MFNKGNLSNLYLQTLVTQYKINHKTSKKAILYNVFNIGRSKPEKVKNFVDEIMKQLKNKKMKMKKVSKTNNNEPLITYS